MATKMTGPYGDWRDQADALQEVNDKLGVSGLSSEQEWARFEEFLKHFKPLSGWTCRHCEKRVSVFSMIRCADCKAVYCEFCIVPHFRGPDFKEPTFPLPQ